MPDLLRFELGDVKYKNPVFLASGPAGYGLEYGGLIQLDLLGGVVTKTITMKPRGGNPGRRLQETSSGLLNSIGLENVGAERFFSEKLPSLLDNNVETVVSVAADNWSDYEGVLQIVAANKDVKAVELNLSCPNVEEGGMTLGIDPVQVEKYVSRAVNVLEGKVVIAKLTPNVTDITELALAASEAGADAITAINTVTGMDIDIDMEEPVFRQVGAGLSGPAVLPIALYAVWKISRRVNIPVFGVGGISSPQDARKFFMAGASAIQIGTAIFYDPELPERVIENLRVEGVPKIMGSDD